MRTDNVYGAIERRLRDENFEVLHLHRDSRGDWGDDGGYIISISKKREMIYLHILQVNYNVNVSIHILEPTDQQRFIKNNCKIYNDYLLFHSVEDAQKEIDIFLNYLDQAILLEEKEIYYFTSGYVDKNWEIPEGFQDLSYQYLSMLSTCYSAYGDYSDKERKALSNLSKTQYTPDYSDPKQYY